MNVCAWMILRLMETYWGRCEGKQAEKIKGNKPSVLPQPLHQILPPSSFPYFPG